jgi:hypothetical protein
MGKMMTAALAGAFLGLAIGGASAAVPVIPGPFASYNLNGNFVIEAHGIEIITPTRRTSVKTPS